MAAADQYALAATAYHLLTGSQLFPNSNPAVVISRHLSSPPPPMGNTRADLARIDPVLAVALAKSSDERFPSCGDFALTLAEEAVAARGEASPTARTRPSPASPKAATVAPTPLHNSPHRPSLFGHRDCGRRRRSLATGLIVSAVYGLLSRSPQSTQNQQPGGPTASSSAMTAPAITPTSEQSTTLVAPPPPTTTQGPQGNGYAMTGCYSSQNPPVDRPTYVELLFCASGGLSLNDMSWTSWGPYGADGSGMSSFRVCPTKLR